MDSDYTVVFERLAEFEVDGSDLQEISVSMIEPIIDMAELDEIDELRRLSAELNAPEPVLFTTAG